MVRMQVILEPAEADALLKLANAEFRDPREQMRVMVRDGLMRRGLLPKAIKTSVGRAVR